MDLNMYLEVCIDYWYRGEKVRIGSQEWYRKRYKDLVKEEAKLSNREKFKVSLSLTLKDLKVMKHPLYDVIKQKYPKLADETRISDARDFKLLEKVFTESSMKALEMTYKLDGSLTDIKNEVDYETVEKMTEDVG